MFDLSIFCEKFSLRDIEGAFIYPRYFNENVSNNSWFGLENFNGHIDFITSLEKLCQTVPLYIGLIQIESIDWSELDQNKIENIDDIMFSNFLIITDNLGFVFYNYFTDYTICNNYKGYGDILFQSSLKDYAIAYGGVFSHAENSTDFKISKFLDNTVRH